jgi:hypothetical protein
MNPMQSPNVGVGGKDHAHRNKNSGNVYSASKKRGCPTCAGIDAKSCMRCRGKTRLCDWVETDMGWTPNAKVRGAHDGLEK